MYPKCLYIETCHPFVIKLAKIFAKYLVEHILKIPNLYPNLTPPENHTKIFENQKLNTTIQTPIQYTTFHQHTSFTKYLYLLRCGLICPSMSQIFHPYKFELFDWKTKNLNFTFSFLAHCPQPKYNKNSPKDPKLILILTMKQVDTYRCCLLVICLGHPVQLTWAPKNSTTSSNHLQSIQANQRNLRIVDCTKLFSQSTPKRHWILLVPPPLSSGSLAPFPWFPRPFPLVPSPLSSTQ